MNDNKKKKIFLILMLLHFLCFDGFNVLLIFNFCITLLANILVYSLKGWWWNSCILLGVISLLLKCLFFFVHLCIWLVLLFTGQKYAKKCLWPLQVFIFKCFARWNCVGHCIMSLYYALLRSSYPLCCMLVTENGFGEKGFFIVNCLIVPIIK